MLILLGVIVIILLVMNISLLCFMRYICRWTDDNITEEERYKQYYILLNHWLMLSQKKINLEGYFLQRGYQSIAIYGAGPLGCRLCDELENTSIEVKVMVDRNANSIYYRKNVLKPEEGLSNLEVDLIVVTVPVEFEQIRQYMSKQPKQIPMVALPDVIYAV